MTNFAATLDKDYGVRDRAGTEFLTHMRAQLQESRKWTYDHCMRVGNLAQKFALFLGTSEQAAENLGLVVSCHDVGKMSVPAEVLNKLELTKNEKAMIRDHSRQGGAMLEGSVSSPLVALAAGVAANHHEHFDGTGYRHKKGNEIPLGAQITALCDTFDALRSKRPYKEAYPIKKVLMIQTGKLRTCYNPLLLKDFIVYQAKIHQQELGKNTILSLVKRLTQDPQSQDGVSPSSSQKHRPKI